MGLNGLILISYLRGFNALFISHFFREIFHILNFIVYKKPFYQEYIWNLLEFIGYLFWKE